MSLAQIAAIGLFVLLLVVLPLAAVAIAVSRSRLTAFQCFLWSSAYLFCKFLWRTRWLNHPQLLPGQGGIIVCNHRSSVDPFFIQSATLRKIHWMVAREYCQHPVFSHFLAVCEVIPVGRGGIDTAATKAAIRLAASGEIVGMLPEGRINMSEDFMLPVRPGAALVAIKAGVPVIPCYIHGAPYRRYPWSPFLMPARVEVRFGPPLYPINGGHNAEDACAHEFIRQILTALATLAGQPNFEPQIAGRNWKPTAEELNAAMDAKDLRDAASANPEGVSG